MPSSGALQIGFDSAVPAPLAAQPVRAIPLQFTGRASEYFRIWIVGVALSLLTLGVYSAWAKVRSQQYFYRHTWLDGSSFEYLADPRELLRGRLLLAGVLGVLFGLQVFFSWGSLPVLLLLLAATPWVVVRSVAFRAHNSAFRNVRFGFSAGLGSAYAAYFKGYLYTLLTCGLAWPGARWRQLDHLLPRLRYGSARATWRTQRGEFYSAYLLASLWLLPALAVRWIASGGRVTAPSGAPAWLALYACFFLATIQQRAQAANLIYGGVRIGPHRLRSTQSFGPLLVLYATNTLAVLATLGLAIPWAKVRLARYRVDTLLLEARGPLDVTARLEPANRGYGDAAADLGGIDLGIG